ncbi:hypothetical protein GCK32_009528, partial [Trichostrongylus colubriformis]
LLAIIMLSCCLAYCLCTTSDECDGDSVDSMDGRRHCGTSNGTVCSGKNFRYSPNNGTPCSPTYAYPDYISQDPNYYLPGYPPPYPPAYPQNYPSQTVQSPPQYCSLQSRRTSTMSPQLHAPS